MSRRRSRKRWTPTKPAAGPRNTSVADAIKLRVASYFVRKNRACFFELGLCDGGRLRADIFVLAMNGYAVVVEVKSSLADFRSDKKMHLYEPYANKIYIALPEPVYLKVKDEILDGWGVFIMDETGLHIRKVVPARNYDIDPEVVEELCIRAAFRSSDTNTSKSKFVIAP